MCHVSGNIWLDLLQWNGPKAQCLDKTTFSLPRKSCPHQLHPLGALCLQRLPAQLGPSVISLLQQQKARQVASGANNTPLTGAAGLLANAANEVAKSSTPLSTSNQPTIIQLPHPHMVQQVPTLIQIVPAMPQISQNASVLVVASQPQQPAPVPINCSYSAAETYKESAHFRQFLWGQKVNYARH